MRAIAVGGVLIAQLWSVAASSGQTLGDVAKQEDARRRTVKAASKTYTNDNLRVEPPPAAPPVSASGAGTAADNGAQAPSAQTPPTPAGTAPAGSAPTSAHAPAGQTPSTQAAPANAAAKTAAGAEVRDEKYWRGRIDAARAALVTDQTLIDALQSRVNALSADFVNRDDPAQRNVVASDRQKALAELDRLKQDLVAQQKAILETQEAARRANVPAGWVR